MYEFDTTNPEEAKKLESLIEQAVLSVNRHLVKLQSEPVEYSRDYGWTGAGNDQFYKPIMEKLRLQTTQVLNTAQGYGHKTEWLGTNNPNVIVLTYHSNFFKYF